MKITIIGSTSYQEKMRAHRETLEKEGYEVFIPAFDNHPGWDELQICEYNRSLIEQADEVHLIWDGRSAGSVFDFGVCFGLKKPVRIVYINDKTLEGLFRRYAAQCTGVSTP